VKLSTILRSAGVATEIISDLLEKHGDDPEVETPQERNPRKRGNARKRPKTAKTNRRDFPSEDE